MKIVVWLNNGGVPSDVALEEVRAVPSISLHPGLHLNSLVIGAAADDQRLAGLGRRAPSGPDGPQRKRPRAGLSVSSPGSDEDEGVRVVYLTVTIRVDAQATRRPSPYSLLALAAVGPDAVEVDELVLTVEQAAGFSLDDLAPWLQVGPGGGAGLVAAAAVLQVT